MQFIDLQAQYQHLKQRIDKRIETVLNHGKYIMGPEVQELEEKLAEYVGVKHAITCANGTDALTLSMMVLDIKQGDAVFCPTFTFFATAETVAFANATPVFVDSDKDTFNICPVDLEIQINRVLNEGALKPKAIIAVDLFGLPANYPELELIAKKYKLKLIEDAAQGFGGSINGKKAGSFGDIATTSFFPAKPLGCYGDGGAVFTDNDEYADQLRSYRVHGKGRDKYDNVRIGVNSRLDTIQAAILLEKLEEFPKELVRRNELANIYRANISNLFTLPTTPTGYISSWAQFTLTIKDREFWIDKLKSENIPSAIYYGKCMHQQTAFNSLNIKFGDLSVAENLANEAFSLPMHPYFEYEEVLKISSVLSKV
jgi:dTDP-4-amino-4,6-dideoxygalactose transaminase